MINLTNKEIALELKGLYRQIFVSECFSGNDIVRYELLLKEAERRELKVGQNIIDKENALYE